MQGGRAFHVRKWDIDTRGSKWKGGLRGGAGPWVLSGPSAQPHPGPALAAPPGARTHLLRRAGDQPSHGLGLSCLQMPWPGVSSRPWEHPSQASSPQGAGGGQQVCVSSGGVQSSYTHAVAQRPSAQWGAHPTREEATSGLCPSSLHSSPWTWGLAARPAGPVHSLGTRLCPRSHMPAAEFTAQPVHAPAQMLLGGLEGPPPTDDSHVSATLSPGSY